MNVAQQDARRSIHSREASAPSSVVAVKSAKKEKLTTGQALLQFKVT